MAAGLLAAAFLAACNTGERATVEQLRSTLPTVVDGIALDLVQVVDGRFLSGHAVDAVLAALGSSRDDASVVFLEASSGSGGVGAISIDGVRGPALISAVVSHWDAPAISQRVEVQVGARRAWRLVARTGPETYVLAKGDVVYLAISANADRARVLAEQLP